MQKLLLILFALCLFTSSKAQFDSWPSPTQQNLHDVYFMDLNNGVVVGDSGIILRTINGGDSWFFVLGIDSIEFRKVKFFDNDCGIAMGDQLYRTTDAGITWSRVQHPNSRFFDIEILDSTTCVISGEPNRLIKSTDRGASFSTLFDSSSNIFHYQLSFVNDSIGYSLTSSPGQLYNNRLRKTVDGGHTWASIFSSLPASTINELVFLAEDTALISAQTDYLAKTFNGGGNWQMAQSTDPTFYTNILDFHTNPDYPEAFYACGWYGAYKSIDQGLSWNAIEFDLDPGVGPFAIFFIDDQIGWAVSFQGKIYKTFNGGFVNREEAAPPIQEWLTIYPNPSSGIFKLDFKKRVPKANLKVYNALGQFLMEFSSTAKEIDLSAYPNGMYLVALETGSQTLYHRLIKE